LVLVVPFGSCLGLELELCECGDERFKLLSPVVPATGNQVDPRAFDARQHPIAVELHLMEPVVAGRRGVYERGELRRDKAREGGLPRPGQRRQLIVQGYCGWARIAVRVFVPSGPDRAEEAPVLV
jgi:hypothetical protein